MSRLTKLLVGLFIIIVIITLGELIYLFVYLPTVKHTTKPPVSLTQTPSNSAPQYASVSSYIVRKTDPNQAISPEIYVRFLYLLPQFKKGVLVKSHVTNIYEGTITRLKVTESAQADQVKLSMDLKGSEGFINGFNFLARDVDQASWKQVVNGKEEPWSYKDLQVGDSVQIDSVISLIGTFPKNRISLSFTKLE